MKSPPNPQLKVVSPNIWMIWMFQKSWGCWKSSNVGSILMFFHAGVVSALPTARGKWTPGSCATCRVASATRRGEGVTVDGDGPKWCEWVRKSIWNIFLNIRESAFSLKFRETIFVFFGDIIWYTYYWSRPIEGLEHCKAFLVWLNRISCLRPYECVPDSKDCVDWTHWDLWWHFLQQWPLRCGTLGSCTIGAAVACTHCTPSDRHIGTKSGAFWL